MITQQRLHELFEYRDDGNLIRKMSVRGGNKIGDVVGSINREGYYAVNVDGTQTYIHRMIFLYHHGYLTDGLQIDHKDNNRANNRIENLREVTRSQNMHNSKIPSSNTSGIKGVSWSKKRQKWKAAIKKNYKTILLGYYDTIEEAAAAVEKGRKELHGDFARHD
jgi:hypothetical protein